MDEPNAAIKDIGSLFAGYSIPTMGPPGRSGKVSERAEIIRYFFENASADWTGKAPLTARMIAVKLSYLSTFDLHAFKSQCEDRRRKGYPWAKYFWGVLKSR